MKARSWTPTARTLRYLERLADQAARAAQQLEDAFATFEAAGYQRPLVRHGDVEQPVRFDRSHTYYQRTRTRLGQLAELAEDGVNPFTGEASAAPAATGPSSSGGAQ